MQRSYVSLPCILMQNLLFHKRQKFDDFWPEPSKVAKICILIGSYFAKYLMFDLKNYRGVIFHDTEGWFKIWRKTDLWFGKSHQEYGKFSPEYLKVSALGLWWDPVIQSRKCMNLKFTEELSVMIMKNDAKFEEELTCRFKLDMGNLINFDSSTWTSKKSFTLMRSFWAKYIFFELNFCGKL